MLINDPSISELAQAILNFKVFPLALMAEEILYNFIRSFCGV
jgi:hypothetical protein